MATIALHEVTKEFAGGVRAVDALELEIGDGELMVLVGPSGCGKTTALRMIAGLEPVTAGTIAIDGRRVNDIRSASRDIAMVFQNYALYPHMTVFANIAFGLRQRRTPKAEIEERVRAVARTLELEGLLQRRPRELSGGQRQRVAMGRAIVRRPAVFLMDEPLSNLDAKLRVQMRGEIRALQREVGVTTVYVTHDQVEAMTMGGRVAVLRKGQLQQVGSPHELYRRPENIFVAGFIGSPAMNLVEAELVAGDSLALRVGSQTIDLRALEPDLREHAGRRVAVGVRPEALRLADAADRAALIGEAVDVEDLGAEVIAHLQIDARPVVTEDVRELAGDADDVSLQALSEAARRNEARIVARLEAESPIRPGDRVPLALDVVRLHFFDLETGSALRKRSRDEVDASIAV